MYEWNCVVKVCSKTDEEPTQSNTQCQQIQPLSRMNVAVLFQV